MMNAAQGAAMGKRYLRLDKLLPGDVFLSKGVGPESDRIARLTFGPFSHASIHTHFGLLFEAIGNGVGYTGLSVAKYCDHGGYLLDVSKYDRLQIRRHPALHARCATPMGQRALAEELGELLLPENGKEYPLPTALAHAAPFIPALLLLPYLWFLELQPAERIKKAPGLFCSQLVAGALIQLQAYPLKSGWFGRQLPARRISPNHLQFSSSLLEIVPHVIVDETFPCEHPEPTAQREQQRQYERGRMLQEAQNVQRQALAVMDKHAALKLRLALSAVEDAYEDLREMMG
jgi:hypothetical protein